MATLSPARRWALCLSSVYSRLTKRGDDNLAGMTWWSRQRAWDALRQSWDIKGRTGAMRHDAAMKTLVWLRDEGDRAAAAGGGADAARAWLAWDMGRLVHVARIARHAAFVSDEEAWPFVEHAARAVQAAFRSWQDYAEAFLAGRAMWAGGEERSFREATTALLADPRSIWRTLEWTTPL